MKKIICIIVFISLNEPFVLGLAPQSQNTRHEKFELVEDISDIYPADSDRFEKHAFETMFEGFIIRRGNELYVLKYHIPETAGLRWKDQNDPIREYVAFRISRAVGSNICDVIIPEKAERLYLANIVSTEENPVHPDQVYLVRLGFNYKRDDDQVIQKDFYTAVIYNFLTAFLLRVYDYNNLNISRLEDSDVNITFDEEQGFHPSCLDVESFSKLFIDGYFQGAYPKKLSDFCDRVINLDVIRKFIAFLDGLPLEKILEEIASDIRKTEIHYSDSALEEHFSFVRNTRRRFRKDLVDFICKILDYNGPKINRDIADDEVARLKLKIASAILPAEYSHDKPRQSNVLAGA
ncbi:MAG: hypothetical protein JW774_04270 [Candidatus Aureabacteria bacterium]|nr:hypothetical protein [Candidatus Auribacterota bacterium]